MAFPTVADADTKTGAVGTNSTSWTITYCTNIAAGDLLLLLAAIDRATASQMVAGGWTVLLDVAGGTAGNPVSLQVLGRVAVGTETGTFTATIGASEQGAWTMLRIPSASWYGGVLSAGTSSNASTGVAAATNASTGGSTNAPDPPSLTPAWGAADDLWIAFAAHDLGIISPGNVIVTAGPASYTDFSSLEAGTSGGAGYGIARRALNAASENPGTFTQSTGSGVATATIAIRPTTAASSGTGGVTWRRASVASTAAETITATGAEAFRRPSISAFSSAPVNGTGGITFRRSAFAAVADAQPPRRRELTFAETLATHHAPLSRVEFLAADLDTVLGTLDGRLVSGSVTTDRTTDTYASASVDAVTVDNRVDAATRDLLTSLIVASRPVRISRGALVNGVPILKPQITGLITDDEDDDPSAHVSFSVSSRLSIAKRKFQGVTTIAEGVRVRDAIRQLLELGGLGTSDELYDLDDDVQSVTVARTFDTSDEILGAAIKWAFDYGLDLLVDGSGVVIMRPSIDAAAAAVAWDFAPGPVRTLVALRRRTRGVSQLFNRQRVYGRGADGYDVMGEARVTDPASPLYWRVDFDLPAEPYSSPDITTVAQCETVAARLLFENNTLEETRSADVVPIPLISAGDVVMFSAAGLGDRFLLDSTTLPIYKGSMRLQARRVQSA